MNFECKSNFSVRLTALCLALALAPGASIAQEADATLPDVKIGSVEFDKLPGNVRIQIVRKPVIASLNRLRDLVPSLVDDGSYVYTGNEVELQAIIDLMRTLTDDLSIGQPLYQQISAGMADANALSKLVDESTVFTKEQKTQRLAKIETQIDGWENLRIDFDLLRNQMKDFVEQRGPAIQDAYNIDVQIEENAKVQEEFVELRAAVQGVLNFANSEAGQGNTGTD